MEEEELVDPYEIIITDEDMPPNGGAAFTEEMVSISVQYPKRWVRRIDLAAANIGTARPHVMRAILRQAIENEGAIIRTKWGRSHVV